MLQYFATVILPPWRILASIVVFWSDSYKIILWHCSTWYCHRMAEDSCPRSLCSISFRTEDRVRTSSKVYVTFFNWFEFSYMNLLELSSFPALVMHRFALKDWNITKIMISIWSMLNCISDSSQGNALPAEQWLEKLWTPHSTILGLITLLYAAQMHMLYIP